MLLILMQKSTAETCSSLPDTRSCSPAAQSAHQDIFFPQQPRKQFLINKIFLGKTKWFKGKPWPVCYANESAPSLPRNITTISKYDKMMYWLYRHASDATAGRGDATFPSARGTRATSRHQLRSAAVLLPHTKSRCVILPKDALSRWEGGWKGPLQPSNPTSLLKWDRSRGWAQP